MMAEDLIPVMQQVAGAAEAVLKAWQRARAAGQVERVISLNLVMRSQSDAMLALAELLESEAPPYPPPDGGGSKGGRRLRAVRVTRLLPLGLLACGHDDHDQGHQHGDDLRPVETT